MILAGMLLTQAALQTVPTCNQAEADKGIQQEMNICAYRDFVIADAKLNEQWKATSAKMKMLDEAMKEYDIEGDGRPGYFESLLEAQRAWLKYRDAHCRVDGYYARGGSLEPLLVSTCKTGLTEERTRQLKELEEAGA